MNSWQWKAVVEKKAHRERIWRFMGNEQFTRGMWEYFSQKRDDAAREKQEGIQGQWQQESPFREIMEQARRDEDTESSSEIMRKSNIAKRCSRGHWELYVKLSRKW